MADSLEDLGTGGSALLFPLEPNWASNPTTDLAMLRRVLSQRGTSHQLKSLTDDVPLKFKAGFTLLNKEQECTLLEFFCARLGRCQRFWIKHPRRHFELKSTATNGSATLVCNSNGFELQYQGYERIYILMNNGDVLTRKVTGATDDGSELTLNINTVLDREVTTDNHYRIGRLLWARFDNDELAERCVTNTICETSLDFVELVQEYSEIS